MLAGDDEKELVTEAAIRRLLANQGIGPEQVEVLRAVVYSHHVRFAAKWRVGRVFLAGDAAHVMPPWIGQGMASGVRDVGNLCWKLAAVINGELPDTILDSYETERQPHVRKVTKAAVNIGRIIIERNHTITTLRDPILRAVMKLPGVGTFIRSAKWFPDSKYPDGMLAPTGAKVRRLGRIDRPGADGWQIPQSWVLDPEGQRTRLDDAVPAGWTVFRTARATIDEATEAWAKAGVPVFDVLAPGALASIGAVVDVDGTFLAWMGERAVDVVVVRPDGFTYNSGSADRPVAKPPFLARVNSLNPVPAVPLEVPA